MTASPDLSLSRTGAAATRAGAIAAVGSVLAVVVVGLVGKALGAPDVMQLSTPALATLTIVGVAVATLGWVLISRRHGGARLLRVLVPVVLLVSFVPDLLLGVSGTAWGAVATLMCAHLAVFLVTIPVLARMLPPEAFAR